MLAPSNTVLIALDASGSAGRFSLQKVLMSLGVFMVQTFYGDTYRPARGGSDVCTIWLPL